VKTCEEKKTSFFNHSLTDNSSFTQPANTAPITAKSAVQQNSIGLSEHAVLQDLLLAFRGIGGEIFRDDFGDGSFRISAKVEPPLRHHAAHLAELGTLHVCVRRRIDAVPHVGAPNCLTALATALGLQLNEFGQLITQFEAMLNQDGGKSTYNATSSSTSSSVCPTTNAVVGNCGRYL
jgi:hypothetical protein